MKKNKNLPMFGLKALYPFIKKNVKYIFLMLIFGSISELASVFMPLFQKYAIDNFIEKSTYNSIGIFVAVYLLMIALTGLITGLSTRMSFKGEMAIKRDLRNKAYKHIQTLSFSFFNKYSVGYIHSRLMSDVTSIAFLVSMHAPYIIINSAYLIGSIIVMLLINAKLGLIIMAVLPVMALVFWAFQNKLIKINRKIREKNSKITADFNQEITGSKTIKSLAIEDRMIKNFVFDTSEMKRESVRYAKYGGLFQGIISFTSSVIIAILLFKGGVISASEVGTFSMFMTYAQSMADPLKFIVMDISHLITCQVNIERYVDIMNTKSETADREDVVEKYGDVFNPKRENFEKLKGNIEFKNVWFRYPDGEENVLENFSLLIPHGCHLAIAGETGAGKSTIVNLICRFFHPTSGKILVDGDDIQNRSLLWLHSSIGYVLQSPQLFSGTIRDNLKYGKEDATDEEILKALDMVSARDIVYKLKDGLDSDVGEGGDLLSQGEKQLLSFARAIIVNPEILILDEATSSVDTITEQKIQIATEKVIKGRTSIVIAHRLSTIKNADIILVIKGGKIVEMGSHRELIHKKGYYELLYREQYEQEETLSLLNN